MVGITGGVATGKSAFCLELRKLLPSASYFDADRAAHALTSRAPDVRELIQRHFGMDAYTASGELNRGLMREKVFMDPDARKVLEQILHPRIRAQWTAAAQEARRSGQIYIADIPLLYETQGDSFCDKVVVVACSRLVQLARLRLRSGMTDALAGRIRNSQMQLTEKIRLADHVVWNDAGPSCLETQAALLANRWLD